MIVIVILIADSNAFPTKVPISANKIPTFMAHTHTNTCEEIGQPSFNEAASMRRHKPTTNRLISKLQLELCKIPGMYRITCYGCSQPAKQTKSTKSTGFDGHCQATAKTQLMPFSWYPAILTYNAVSFP